MSEESEPGRHLREALEEHSAEGVEILMAEPSRLVRGLIWALFTLLIAAGAWSFIGRADVTVTTQGVLGPAADERRVYSPVDGELVELFIAEGMPVSKGDVLARVNAVNAVELATRAMEAKLKLDEAERGAQLLPARKRVIEKQLELLDSRIATTEQEYKQRQSEAVAKLAEEQKIRLQKARANLDEARREMDYAEREARKYRRLADSPGGGGISRQDVEAREHEYRAKRTAYELARAELAQFEVDLGREYRQRREEIQQKAEELLQLRADYEQKKLELDTLENQVNSQLRVARASYEGAARVTFDDIDEENFLLVRAPVSGVVTRLAQTQPGDKVGASRPLASIAPAGSRTVLNVTIDERDRAFLRQGMPARLKFAAFPYQRYGFVDGRLEYISPTASADPQTHRLVYEGHVALDRDTFAIGDAEVPLRYGMSGTAEIDVRKRRLIDMALDPLREATAW